MSLEFHTPTSAKCKHFRVFCGFSDVNWRCIFIYIYPYSGIAIRVTPMATRVITLICPSSSVSYPRCLILALFMPYFTKVETFSRKWDVFAVIVSCLIFCQAQLPSRNYLSLAVQSWHFSQINWLDSKTSFKQNDWEYVHNEVCCFQLISALKTSGEFDVTVVDYSQ